MLREKNTKALIPFIERSDNDTLLIDARLLHEQMGVTSKFADWVKNRISDFDFKENEDFFSNFRKSRFGRSKKEYHLTLDMAKELAMVERNEQGRQIRRYFIAAEKEFREKRLYGQVSTLSTLKRKCQTMDVLGSTIYNYRDVQRQLGYSTKGSLNNVRRKYEGQLLVINHMSFVTEAYVKLMISRATSRHLSVETEKAKPILPKGFGEELPLKFEIL